MILGFLFLTQTFLKYCKALSTEKHRRHINIYYYYYYYYYYYIIIIIILLLIYLKPRSTQACFSLFLN